MRKICKIMAMVLAVLVALSATSCKKTEKRISGTFVGKLNSNTRCEMKFRTDHTVYITIENTLGSNNTTTSGGFEYTYYDNTISFGKYLPKLVLSSTFEFVECEVKSESRMTLYYKVNGYSPSSCELQRK